MKQYRGPARRSFVSPEVDAEREEKTRLRNNEYARRYQAKKAAERKKAKDTARVSQAAD